MTRFVTNLRSINPHSVVIGQQLFTVHWRHSVPESIVLISICMDGVLVYQLLSMPGAKGGQLGGVVSGPASIRPFAFSIVPRLGALPGYNLCCCSKAESMTESDTGSASAGATVYRHFGTIRVTFVPIRAQSTPTLPGGPLCSNISPSPLSDMHCIS